MTKETPYFRPRNWHKFQRRSNHTISWVKVHVAILDDEDLNSLTEYQQLIAYKLLPVFGRIGRALPWDCGYIARTLRLDYRRIGTALQALKDIGFIELCDRTSDLWEKMDAPREDKRRVDKKYTPRPPTEGSPPKPNGKIRKGTRLPEDWQPTEREIAYARERGFDEAHIRDIAEDFRTYWTAGNGRNRTHADWTRAWQTWARKERPRSNQPAKHDASRDRLGHGSLAAAVRRNLV